MARHPLRLPVRNTVCDSGRLVATTILKIAPGDQPTATSRGSAAVISSKLPLRLICGGSSGHRRSSARLRSIRRGRQRPTCCPQSAILDGGSVLLPAVESVKARVRQRVGSSRSRGWELTFDAALAPRSVDCRIPAARSTQSSDRNGRGAVVGHPAGIEAGQPLE